MREILFRGKGNPEFNDGEWFEGYLIKCNDGYYQMFCNSCCRFTVIPETVGQYTGFQDKNDFKIFEDDLIKYMGSIYKVVWATGCWMLEHDGIICFTLYTVLSDKKRPCELMGNIHDNPELLRNVY